MTIFYTKCRYKKKELTKQLIQLGSRVDKVDHQKIRLCFLIFKEHLLGWEKTKKLLLKDLQVTHHMEVSHQLSLNHMIEQTQKTVFHQTEIIFRITLISTFRYRISI